MCLELARRPRCVRFYISAFQVVSGRFACRFGSTDSLSNFVTLFWTRVCSVCDRINTASRWSYCEMSPFSFSARALFSWHSLVLRLLCSSIWTWISLSVPWKWVVISFLFRSSSLHLCRVSSCISVMDVKAQNNLVYDTFAINAAT